VKIVSGDLLDLANRGCFDVIVHGCNCHCEMGAGIALAIARTYPEALAADRATAPADRSKLGQLSVARITTGAAGPFSIVNGYTQYDWAGAGVLVDYDAVRGVFRRVRQRFVGLRIGYPKLGAGLAGGDWTVISGIIDQELDGEDHTLVTFSSS